MKARDNPFRTERIAEVRYRLSGISWDNLLARLKNLDYRAAIVGPEGAGKTTLLEDLEPKLQSLGFHVLNLRLDRSHRKFPREVEERLWAGLTRQNIILLDGAEQMAWLDWRRFKQTSLSGGGLVITSHKKGLMPTLITCATTPGLFDEIVRELVGTEAISLQTISVSLFAKHRGNIRAALRELYDIYAEKEKRA